MAMDGVATEAEPFECEVPAPRIRSGTCDPYMQAPARALRYDEAGDRCNLEQMRSTGRDHLGP